MFKYPVLFVDASLSLSVAFAEAGALMRYGDRFRNMRKLMHRELTSAALEKYWPLHEEESRVLVRNSLREPQSLLDLIRQ